MIAFGTVQTPTHSVPPPSPFPTHMRTHNQPCTSLLPPQKNKTTPPPPQVLDKEEVDEEEEEADEAAAGGGLMGDEDLDAFIEGDEDEDEEEEEEVRGAFCWGGGENFVVEKGVCFGGWGRGW